MIRQDKNYCACQYPVLQVNQNYWGTLKLVSRFQYRELSKRVDSKTALKKLGYDFMAQALFFNQTPI